MLWGKISGSKCPGGKVSEHVKNNAACNYVTDDVLIYLAKIKKLEICRINALLLKFRKHCKLWKLKHALVKNQCSL